MDKTWKYCRYGAQLVVGKTGRIESLTFCQLAAKTAEVEGLKKDLAARSRDLEHTARQRDELNEAYKKLCQSERSLYEDISRLRNDKAARSVEITALKRRLADRDAELAAAAVQLAKPADMVAADLIEHCHVRDMQMLAMIDELQELQAENKQLKKDNATLGDSLHKAQTDVDYARTGTGAVARELRQIQGNRSAVDVLRIALDDTLTENKQLKRAIARLEGRE